MAPVEKTAQGEESLPEFLLKTALRNGTAGD